MTKDVKPGTVYDYWHQILTIGVWFFGRVFVFNQSIFNRIQALLIWVVARPSYIFKHITWSCFAGWGLTCFAPTTHSRKGTSVAEVGVGVNVLGVQVRHDHIHEIVVRDSYSGGAYFVWWLCLYGSQVGLRVLVQMAAV